MAKPLDPGAIADQLACAHWSEHDLLRSLKDLGPILPLYVWRGHVLDGRRRRRLCHKFSIRITTRLVTDDEAPRLLWVLAPARALDRWQDYDVLAQSELFGVSPSQVASIRAKIAAAALPPMRRQRAKRSVPGESLAQMNIKMEPQKLEALRHRARKRGMTLSDYCRELL